MMYDKLVKELRLACDDERYGGKYLYLTLINRAADAIEDLGNKLNLWRQDKISRWIPVTERLPSEELAFYLCYTDAGIVVECLWTNDKYGLGPFGNWGWRLMDVPQYQKVTYWMPLPEPPKEETE